MDTKWLGLKQHRVIYDMLRQNLTIRVSGCRVRDLVDMDGDAVVEGISGRIIKDLYKRGIVTSVGKCDNGEERYELSLAAKMKFSGGMYKQELTA